jgi:hypothetical protein
LPRCPKVGRTITPALVDWCKRHGVSFDWLLAGNLRSLQQMMEARRIEKAAVTPESLREKIAPLSDSEREIIRRMVQEMLLPAG